MSDQYQFKWEMNPQLYWDWQIFDLLEWEESEFGHHFGGPIAHEGLAEEQCGFPCHLLCRLNTDDPDIAIRIPGARWLPLYYSFCYENESMQTSYRVLSNSRVETYFDRTQSLKLGDDRFPYEDFPETFPERPLTLDLLAFDPTNREHVEAYVNVFGIERLSAADRSEYLEQLARNWDSWGGLEPWSGSEDELINSEAAPCPQGPPQSPCPNPRCGNHEQHGSMQLFAYIPSIPADGWSLWGEYGDDTVILYEICPLCFAITATNQCT